MTPTSAVAVLQGMPAPSMFEGLLDQNTTSSTPSSALELMKDVSTVAKAVLQSLGRDIRHADVTLEIVRAASLEVAAGRNAGLVEGLCEDALLAYGQLADEGRALAARLNAALL